MSQKVIEVAAGEAHTLVLTGDGCVFSWGRGTFGRLGNGEEEDQSFPAPVNFNTSKKKGTAAGNMEGGHRFVGIAAGAYHSLALEDDGSVWSWGYNIYGQLGRSEDNSSVPCLVDNFLELGFPDGDHEGKPLKVRSIKAGGMMSVAIDSLGGLWMWGSCPPLSDTNDANFCLVSSPSPQPVWDFQGRTVVKVACGNEHVLALASANESFAGDLVCYSWGNNNHGQLGLGDTKNRTCPKILSTFDVELPWAPYEIACGAFHSAVLTQSKSSTEEIGCKCWTFGLGENGQLGHGTAASPRKPEPVTELPSDTVFISLNCGLFHTCVVSAAGDVWSWGLANGLGLCTDASLDDAGDAFSPVRFEPCGINEPRFPGPVQVACGASHTVLVGDDGNKLWAWGRGRSGVLGAGHTDDSFVPCVVMWPSLHADFENEKLKTDGSLEIPQNVEGQQSTEADQRLSSALAEVKLLHSKLTLMERYASILHVFLFGRAFEEQSIPPSLQESSFLDIRRELENVIETADDVGLARMEGFYRNMLATVKDRVMKRRIQEIVKECLASRSKGVQLPPE